MRLSDKQLVENYKKKRKRQLVFAWSGWLLGFFSLVLLFVFLVII